MLSSKRKPSFRTPTKRKHASPPQTANQVLTRNILVITVVFLGILFFIGILMGFHPPQPDSPILYRAATAHLHERQVHRRGSVPTIFVAMPSVNDPDCNESIASAFDSASAPYRIFFGVHQQTDLDSYPDCLDFSGVSCPSHPICPMLWHVRASRVTDKGARGPTWGRYMSDKHYANETFYLITDSHTLFRKNWDDILIKQWQATQNEYAVITHYPKGQNQMERAMQIWDSTPEKGSAYHICGTFWETSENHMPRNANGCYAKINDMSKPVMVPFWGAGFAFSKSHFRQTVPFDPFTQWLFHGEEFLRATKLWTFGYDFYSPSTDLAFHKYGANAQRGKMPFNEKIKRMRDEAEKRVNFLWGLMDIRTPNLTDIQRTHITRNIEDYGLGPKRTMKQFWKFVECDPYKQNITVFETELWSQGGLERVPWNPPFDKDDPLA